MSIRTHSTNCQTLRQNRKRGPTNIQIDQLFDQLRVDGPNVSAPRVRQVVLLGRTGVGKIKTKCIQVYELAVSMAAVFTIISGSWSAACHGEADGDDTGSRETSGLAKAALKFLLN